MAEKLHQYLPLPSWCFCFCKTCIQIPREIAVGQYCRVVFCICQVVLCFVLFLYIINSMLYNRDQQYEIFIKYLFNVDWKHCTKNMAPWVGICWYLISRLALLGLFPAFSYLLVCHFSWRIVVKLFSVVVLAATHFGRNLLF